MPSAELGILFYCKINVYKIRSGGVMCPLICYNCLI